MTNMMTDDKRLLQKSAGRQILFKSHFVTSEGVLIPEETFGSNSLLAWEKESLLTACEKGFQIYRSPSQEIDFVRRFFNTSSCKKNGSSQISARTTDLVFIFASIRIWLSLTATHAGLFIKFVTYYVCMVVRFYHLVKEHEAFFLQ